MRADYDGLAWCYERWWHDRFHLPLRGVLERLLYPRAPAPARILDLCCGTGHLARVLKARGYDVIGIDCSMDMLRAARGAVDDMRVVCADARAFEVAGCDAVVCTFDSINHLTEPGDLDRLLGCVRRGLRSGGLFLFDVNTAPAYASEWGKSSAEVTADTALFVRGTYDAATRLAQTSITTFHLRDGWHRADHHVVQRCYERSEIEAALRGAGFETIEAHAAATVGMEGEIGTGRLFFTACTP